MWVVTVTEGRGWKNEPGRPGETKPLGRHHSNMQLVLRRLAPSHIPLVCVLLLPHVRFISATDSVGNRLLGDAVRLEPCKPGTIK